MFLKNLRYFNELTIVCYYLKKVYLINFHSVYIYVSFKLLKCRLKEYRFERLNVEATIPSKL